MINVILASFGILFSQYTYPSDECDSCMSVCRTIFSHSSELISDTTSGEVIYSQKDGAYYSLKTRTQTYERLNCEPHANDMPFQGSDWVFSIRLASNEFSDNYEPLRKVYFGNKCKKEKRTFIHSRKLGRLASNRDGDIKDLGKFSWQKMRNLNLANWGTTCDCGLSNNFNGEDRYLAGCRPSNEDGYLDLRQIWMNINGGSRDELINETKIDFYSYGHVSISAFGAITSEPLEIDLDTLSNDGFCKSYGSRIMLCINKYNGAR